MSALILDNAARLLVRARRAMAGGALMLALAPGGWAVAAEPVAGPATAPTTQPDAQRAAILLELRSIEELLTEGEARQALDRVAALRPRLIALEPLQNRDLYRATAYAFRMSQMACVTGKSQHLVQLTKTHPDAMQALMFAISPFGDDSGRGLEILGELAEEFPGQVDRYANLAAAIALVHDETERARDHDPQRSPSPQELFSFFIRNERRLTISPRDLPPELLVYVADADAPIEELQWALDRYGRQRSIGARFFDVPYDYDNFRDGAEKQIERRGYTLPNLVRFGGVCSDQAYFASTVAKAMGVPSAVITGTGPDVGHAWIGYLEIRGRERAWNLESGRYDAYKNVRGVVADPQTRSSRCEGELRLLADLLNTSDDDRLDAIAISDIASFTPFRDAQPVTESSVRRDWRPVSKRPFAAQVGPRYDMATDMSRLLVAVELSPACLSAWEAVETLPSGREAAHLRAWADAVSRLVGRKYPDFAITVIGPLIRGMADPQARDEAWQAAGRAYGGNVDVAADIGLAQARNWLDAGELDLALRRCDAVIRNCGASGPRVVDAVVLAEQIRRQQGREDLLIELYAAAFDSIVVPDAMAGQFMRQTPWFQVGTRYAFWLETSGDQNTATKIRRKLSNMAGSDE